MNFEKLFKILSYTAVFFGFFSVWVSGAFGIIGTGLFIGVMIAAWLLEGTRWQIPEKLGTGLIVLALPLFYLDWKYQFLSFANSENLAPVILVQLILSLVAIKLLQKKSDRDWIFLYLMSMFVVLLAAGLSISALYLGSFLMFLLTMLCSAIVFEIRRTARNMGERSDLGEERAKLIRERTLSEMPVRRLPMTAIILILFTMVVGLPIFFMLPRVGGAGLGRDGGISTSTGFSDVVNLGGIGRIQQNDEVVMRVRLDNRESVDGPLYWRGIALDTFDNKSWRNSRASVKEPFLRRERNLIQIDLPSGKEDLTGQTIYLEPLDTSVLFALSRPIAFQGGFAYLLKDADGSIRFPRSNQRASYRVLSDRRLPGPDRLRRDKSTADSVENRYLQLPADLDPRIPAFAQDIIKGGNNRYDSAKAVETHLQDHFGYSLQMRAQGGQPLADFLFNIREGHCEYFATAMAVMLRTQGIPTRIVNGFQQGEYNETADVYVVRQANAHSWVEVFFPNEGAWVPFDPTPFAGQPINAAGSSAIGDRFSKYFEALEAYWIQYFVGYDDQEQRSLARYVRDAMADYRVESTSILTGYVERLEMWWEDLRGNSGLDRRTTAFLYGVGSVAGALLLILMPPWLYRKIKGYVTRRHLLSWMRGRNVRSIVAFYERMQTILEGKGFERAPHQTPLEFALSTGVPGVVRITEKYNRVRFGEKVLSRDEAREIENLLEDLELDTKTQG
ncbi:MAG: DUF3488 and transglutaminase-like domain-containing protein [Pyrinomonadaceae bacterium]